MQKWMNEKGTERTDLMASERDIDHIVTGLGPTAL